MAAARGCAERRIVALPDCYITIESRARRHDRRTGRLVLVSILAAGAAGLLTAGTGPAVTAACRPSAQISAALQGAPQALGRLASELGGSGATAPASPRRGLKIIISNDLPESVAAAGGEQTGAAAEHHSGNQREQ